MVEIILLLQDFNFCPKKEFLALNCKKPNNVGVWIGFLLLISEGFGLIVIIHLFSKAEYLTSKSDWGGKMALLEEYILLTFSNKYFVNIPQLLIFNSG
jgi:hypothetical protein